MQHLDYGDGGDPGKQGQHLMGEAAHEANQRGTAEQENDEDIERRHGVRLAAASPKFQPLSTKDLVDQRSQVAELCHADALDHLGAGGKPGAFEAQFCSLLEPQRRVGNRPDLAR